MTATFTVTNDQTGDTKDVTLTEWAALQAQSYRILDVAGYGNALAAEPEAKDEPAAAKAETKSEPRSAKP